MSIANFRSAGRNSGRFLAKRRATLHASSLTNLRRDQNGGVLVEVTVMFPIIFMFVLGAIDFLFAFYEWNAAAKAVQVGARIAAVSTPVVNGLKSVDTTASVGNFGPGSSFTVTCNGASGGTCTCSGTCTGVSGYNSTAMNQIVFG